ncbi:TPA: hypothetical protein EYO57_22320, partial [Candidatus Poribacteria bacterium]|nr:hypothetical protein [Candidatus Poribacteria bacterium]
MEPDYTSDCVELMKNVFLHLSGKLEPEDQKHMIAQLRKYGHVVRNRKFLSMVRKFEQHRGGISPRRQERFISMARFSFRHCVGGIFSGIKLCSDIQFFLLVCQYYSKNYLRNLEDLVDQVIHKAPQGEHGYSDDLNALWTGFQSERRLPDKSFERLRAYLIDVCLIPDVETRPTEQDYCESLMRRVQAHSVSHQISEPEVQKLDHEVQAIIQNAPGFLHVSLSNIWARVRDKHPLHISKLDKNRIQKVIYKVCKEESDWGTDYLCDTIDFLLLCTGLPGGIDQQALAFLNQEIPKVLHKHQNHEMMERWKNFFVRGFSRKERELFRDEFRELCKSEPRPEDPRGVQAAVPIPKPVPDTDFMMWDVPQSARESVGMTATMTEASELSDYDAPVDDGTWRTDMHRVKPRPDVIEIDDQKDFAGPSRAELQEQQRRLEEEKVRQEREQARLLEAGEQTRREIEQVRVQQEANRVEKERLDGEAIRIGSDETAKLAANEQNQQRLQDEAQQLEKQREELARLKSRNDQELSDDREALRKKREQLIRDTASLESDKTLHGIQFETYKTLRDTVMTDKEGEKRHAEDI